MKKRVRKSKDILAKEGGDKEGQRASRSRRKAVCCVFLFFHPTPTHSSPFPPLPFCAAFCFKNRNKQPHSHATRRDIDLSSQLESVRQFEFLSSFRFCHSFCAQFE